ncbi:MAG: gliding motility-associated C-terminal domain-containing protein, partial [Cyclobacteriaceae bacterium]|nr:gliding motility-associated C-terminal domain-containing protein [Cyclobacteriaceae bacterium]
NTTAANPIIYEIIYRGTNGNCPTPDQIIPIKVFKSSVANFNEGTLPNFVLPSVNVTFTNTSSVLDGAAFNYDWSFGQNSSPANTSGVANQVVNYTLPGPKEISLVVTNKLSPLCRTEFRKTINIPVPPLKASFTATPTESCFPAKIATQSVIEGADIVEWRVRDANGRIAATSSGAAPVFNLPSEGTYTITLKARYSLTGQEVTATPQTVKVYPKPFASFDARPDVVFVPDTELSTFNFSTGANQYEWDFGDGGNSKEEEPKYTYKVEGSYDIRLIAQFDHGNNVVCADTITRKVVARQGGVTKVPNAFTPNPAGPNGGQSSNGGGQFNDVFLPIVKGAEEFNLQIFDRWGNLIFESNSNQIGWDGYDKNGRILPAGVYVYKLTIRLSDGQRSTQIGDVTMIR